MEPGRCEHAPGDSVTIMSTLHGRWVLSLCNHVFPNTYQRRACRLAKPNDVDYATDIDARLVFVCRMLGFTTAGAVVVEDACLWLLLEGGVLSSMGPTLLFVTISRAGLVGLGQK